MNIGLQAKAHIAITKAIREGRLIRPEKCNRCKNLCKPYAHHNNDLNPLDVIWLCSQCHADKHKELRYQTKVLLNQIYKDAVCIAKSMT